MRLGAYRGRHRIEAVLDRMTTLSESVLESGSRVLIEELGCEAPELQHSVWLNDLDRWAHLDFS